ncbi:hypothetical protein [Phyllobacterium sp.]|uniref:hypothetical protein n=1 Tax=unclassified Phyllobacterium TaxID=2638441 RepID=UPI001AD0CC91|nr:hypothetical protein [Phyllobacterium sp.]MBQ9353143.1 hypothetical protein [Phyllobacterium sp.]
MAIFCAEQQAKNLSTIAATGARIFHNVEYSRVLPRNESASGFCMARRRQKIYAFEHPARYPRKPVTKGYFP